MTVLLVDVILTAVLLVVDLLSKHFVSAAIRSSGEPIVVIKDVLTFRYSENTGAAFGIFDNARVFLCVLVGVVCLALIGFMVYHIVKGKHKERGGLLLHISLSMVVAGGIGNLVDRIAFGYVRDFIEYTFIYTLFGKNFAICNFADVVLTIGVILLILYLIVFYAIDTKKKEPIKETDAPSSVQDEEAEMSEPLSVSPEDERSSGDEED